MDQKSVIMHLLGKGVMHEIDGKFYFTTLFNKLLGKLKDVKTDKLDLPDVPVKPSELYPPTIRLVKAAARVEAILDFCQVPAIITTADGKTYSVRNYDSKTVRTVASIVLNAKYVPSILLLAITDYYSRMDYPKSFKNFILDNDVLAMYSLYEGGKSLPKKQTKTPPKDSTTWL